MNRNKDNIKYKKYTNPDDRISSFPVRINPSKIVKLAYAGYFYNTKGLVKCYMCGVNLPEWRKDICPLERHYLSAPECAFLDTPVLEPRLNSIRDELAKIALNELLGDKGGNSE